MSKLTKGTANNGTRFGLEDGDEKTQKEVADILGISQSYISRLEKNNKEVKKEINRML